MKLTAALLRITRYALIFALLLTVILPLLIPRWPTGVRVATGTETGVYSLIGEALRQQLLQYREFRDVVVTTKRTSGAIENENLLTSHQVDVAFLQGDAPLPRNLSLIARLYTEKLHIIVKDPTIKSIQDLRGRILGVWSEPGSGTDRLLGKVLSSEHLSAQRVSNLSVSAPGSSSVSLYYEKERDSEGMIELRDLAHEFDAGRVSALAAVCGDGAPFVNSRLTEDSLNRDNRILEVVVQGRSELFEGGRIHPAVIPCGIYGSGSDARPIHPVPTVGSDAILAARADLNDGVAYYIARAIFDPTLRTLIPTGPKELYSKQEQPADMTLFHPGVVAYLGNRVPRMPVKFDASRMLTALALAIVLLSPRLLLSLMNLEVTPFKQAGALFYSSWFGRLVIASTISRAVKRDRDSQRLLSEYVELPITVDGATCHNADDLVEVIFRSPHQVCVICGEGGTGKSTLMMRMFYSLATGNRAYALLPFLLRSVGHFPSMTRAVSESARRYGVYINESVLATVLLQCRVILFVDGIDEVARSVRQELLSEVRRLRDSYPSLRIVLATRDAPTGHRECCFVETSLLNGERARALFSRLCQVERQERAKVSDDVWEIVNTPLMVKLLVETVREFGVAPKSKMDLFDRYARELLREPVLGADYDTCERLLRRLSFVLFIERSQTHFTPDLAEEVLLPLVHELKVRRGTDIAPYDFIRACTAAGLLKKDGSVLRFPHVSLMHYFAALELQMMGIADHRRVEELRASGACPEVFEMLSGL
jgi:TRAP-type uncharacterized transport system substrate-binding protein